MTGSQVRILFAAPLFFKAESAGKCNQTPDTGIERRLPLNSPRLSTNIQTRNPEKPKRKHGSTEARVIYELHRHGIYW
jgi:hypothetical protein